MPYKVSSLCQPPDPSWVICRGQGGGRRTNKPPPNPMHTPCTSCLELRDPHKLDPSGSGTKLIPPLSQLAPRRCISGREHTLVSDAWAFIQLMTVRQNQQNRGKMDGQDLLSWKLVFLTTFQKPNKENRTTGQTPTFTAQRDGENDKKLFYLYH